MRYQLDTIPVWDAYKAGGECPLCSLRTLSEEAYGEGFLGDSVMEPATRVQVNALGFCGRHFAMMRTKKNRLGLGLITHTHLQDVIAGLEETLKALEAAETDGTPGSLSGFFHAHTAKPPAERVRARIARCILCERLDFTMRRYAYTLVHLWQSDPEFRRLFAGSKGLCLPDMALVMEVAGATANKKKRRAFFAALSKLQRENLSRIEKELAWFTQKFDYRNQDKPWGNSRDAVERAIGKLRGDRGPAG